MTGSESRLDDTNYLTKPLSGTKNGRAMILGVPVDKMSLDECVARLDESVRTKKPRHLVLVNAAKIVKARYDKELADIIHAADLVGADGVPVVWTSRLLGDPLPGRVNGTDLMERLLALSMQKQYKLYLLGATEHVIEKAAEKFRELYPTLNLVGYRHGYFNSFEEEVKAAEEIAKAQPDILLVGMGTPMKEKWVRRHINRFNVPVIHGVGGSFDLYGGQTKRAPKWMQNWGLEWLYRTMQEPRRLWKRYLFTNIAFIFLAAGAIIKRLFVAKNYQQSQQK